MADSDVPIIGHGKHIAYADTFAGSYTNVPKTIDVQLPQRQLGAAETTNDDSTLYHKEYIPGMFEPGTVPFTYRYTAAGYAAVEAIFALAQASATRGEGDAIKFWKVTLTDGSTATFSGFLTKNDLPTDQEGSPVVDAEIQVTGPMTFTAGTVA